MGNDNHPKRITGNECRKVNCIRHKDYVAWRSGTHGLHFCMECKNAHVSQYKAIDSPKDKD